METQHVIVLRWTLATLPLWIGPKASRSLRTSSQHQRHYETVEKVHIQQLGQICRSVKGGIKPTVKAR